MSGVYGFCFDDGYIPILKREYEELVRDSRVLEILIEEALNNPTFSKNDLLRMTGYVTQEEGEGIADVMAGVFL